MIFQTVEKRQKEGKGTSGKKLAVAKLRIFAQQKCRPRRMPQKRGVTGPQARIGAARSLPLRTTPLKVRLLARRRPFSFEITPRCPCRASAEACRAKRPPRVAVRRTGRKPLSPAARRKSAAFRQAVCPLEKNKNRLPARTLRAGRANTLQHKRGI